MLQWQLTEPPGPVKEGKIVRFGEHSDAVDEDDKPVLIFLVESEGCLHVFMPLFRENDYGMVWCEVGGPLGLQENPARWRHEEKRFKRVGLVSWRFKR